MSFSVFWVYYNKISSNDLRGKLYILKCPGTVCRPTGEGVNGCSDAHIRWIAFAHLGVATSGDLLTSLSPEWTDSFADCCCNISAIEDLSWGWLQKKPFHGHIWDRNPALRYPRNHKKPFLKPNLDDGETIPTTNQRSLRTSFSFSCVWLGAGLGAASCKGNSLGSTQYIEEWLGPYYLTSFSKHKV